MYNLLVQSRHHRLAAGSHARDFTLTAGPRVGAQQFRVQAHGRSRGLGRDSLSRGVSELLSNRGLGFVRCLPALEPHVFLLGAERPLKRIGPRFGGLIPG
jgi:hypothetical protein